MPDWNNVKVIVTDAATGILRRYTDEGRQLLAGKTYIDVIPIVSWHQRGRKDPSGAFVAENAWGYGSGVAFDSLAKLEANGHPRQIVLRDNDPPLAIWAGPDVELSGTLLLDWLDGTFVLTKRD